MDTIKTPVFKLRTPEEQAKIDADLLANTLRDHKRKVNETLERANLPDRQMSRHFKGIKHEGQWGVELDKINARLGGGIICALVGTRGAGKTQLAVSLACVLAQAYMQSLYCTATEMLMRFKATYKADAKQTEEDVVKMFRKPSLLIIDEMNKRAENEWEQRLVFEVLDKRYQDMKDTIIISNQTPVEFCASMGPSLISRINETGGVIECNWESFR